MKKALILICVIFLCVLVWPNILLNTFASASTADVGRWVGSGGNFIERSRS
jgi:hypothetical protein